MYLPRLVLFSGKRKNTTHCFQQRLRTYFSRVSMYMNYQSSSVGQICIKYIHKRRHTISTQHPRTFQKNREKIKLIAFRKLSLQLNYRLYIANLKQLQRKIQQPNKDRSIITITVSQNINTANFNYILLVAPVSVWSGKVIHLVASNHHYIIAVMAI